MKALLIDDMPPARAALRADLAEYCPEVTLLGEADGVVTGAKAVRAQQPELLFLDIQLGDGTGFDLLEILPAPLPKVIFTTASDAFALRAFRYAAVDYLLKPIDPEALQAAVAKAQARNAPADFEHLLDNVRRPEAPRRLALHTQDTIEIVPVADIVRLEAGGNYTQFYFSNNKKLLVTRTLKEFDQMLQDHQFLRVHRSHLVNPAYLKSFVKTDGGYLVLTDGTKVPVSVRKRPEVVRLLDKL